MTRNSGDRPVAPPPAAAALLEEAETVAIALGSNLGDRAAHLRAAADALRALPYCREFRFSAIYDTAAVACPEPLPFLNAACVARCRLPPAHLLIQLQAIERRAQRQRPYPNAPRTLDLDILLFGERIQNGDPILPHPRMGERLFVLVPLCEVWPDGIDPTSGRHLSALLRQCLSHHSRHEVSISRHQWNNDLQ